MTPQVLPCSQGGTLDIREEETVTAEDDDKKFKNLYDKYIYHRDEAAKAKKELVEYVEKLR